MIPVSKITEKGGKVHSHCLYIQRHYSVNTNYIQTDTKCHHLYTFSSLESHIDSQFNSIDWLGFSHSLNKTSGANKKKRNKSANSVPNIYFKFHKIGPRNILLV